MGIQVERDSQSCYSNCFSSYGVGWVVHDDGEEMSIDDLANDLIELELDDEAVGSDCED